MIHETYIELIKKIILHEYLGKIHANSKIQSTFVPVKMHLLEQHIKAGEVYRRSDLEYFSTAIDRHLAHLVQAGTLIKLYSGLYYAPKVSKFGLVPPDDNQVVARFLKGNDFLLVSPNAFNTLGLGLTQLYNTTWVYNHKRKGDFQLNGKIFEFKMKSTFPKDISKEYLLVDLLNNLDHLAEDQMEILNKLPNNLLEYNTEMLMMQTQQYGTGKTKRILKLLVRQQLKHA